VPRVFNYVSNVERHAVSIFCRDCGYEENEFGFIMHLTLHNLHFIQELMLTRGLLDYWESMMARAATATKMSCPICKKEVFWLAEHRETFARPDKVPMLPISDD